MKRSNQLSGDALKEEIWDTLKKVKAGEIDPRVANSVATQSRELLRVVKMQLTIGAMAGKRPTKSLITNFSGRSSSVYEE